MDIPREMCMVTREEKGFIDADVALAVRSRQQHGVTLIMDFCLVLWNGTTTQFKVDTALACLDLTRILQMTSLQHSEWQIAENFTASFSLQKNPDVGSRNVKMLPRTPVYVASEVNGWLSCGKGVVPDGVQKRKQDYAWIRYKPRTRGLMAEKCKVRVL